MEISAATSAVESATSAQGSVIRQADLSAMEQIFVEAFIANGGKATEAALAAGYSEGSAHVSACRLLCRKRVAERIRTVCATFAHSALPVAIKALVDIAGDEQALRKDRIKAANSLVEMAGLMPHGPGVQVNVGVAVNGQQAQQLIASVWTARTERMSDIPASMPDNLQQLEAAIEAIEDEADALEGRGGDQVQGPAVALATLPPSSTANPRVSANSCECEVCRSKDAVTEQAERWLKGGGGVE